MYTRVTRIVLVFCCCYPFELEATPLAQTGGKTYPLYLRMSTAAVAGPIYKDTTRIRSQHSKAVDTEALTSQGNKPSSSNNDDGLSDSDPDLSSNDDGCSSEDDQGRSCTSKRSQWSDLDEQRLLAYKKEGKSWDWIFRKFPGRTPGAVRALEYGSGQGRVDLLQSWTGKNLTSLRFNSGMKEQRVCVKLLLGRDASRPLLEWSLTHCGQP